MLDIDKLIVAVEKRPALYDTRCNEYTNRSKKAKYWQMVAEEVYEDWSELSTNQRNAREKVLMKKWKALRDNFVRDYKVLVGNGSLKKKKYLFYDQLTFLTPYVKHSERSAEAARSDEEDHGEDRMLSSLWDELSNGELVNGQPPEASILVVHEESEEPRKKRAKTSNSLIQDIQEDLHQREECNDMYGNRAFLLSYQPIMDKMDQQTQLHVRLLITQVFYELQRTSEVSQTTTE